MKKGKVSILLTNDIYCLKTNPNPYGAYGKFSPQGQMEYNLYYKNFIYPFEESYDIQCICEFGQKYNTFWHFDGICEKEKFPMEIWVYSAFGELLAEKKVTIHMVSAGENDFNLLCIGDSMTRAGVYITQVTQMLPTVKTVGLKCYDGEHFCEGRGGWRTAQYFNVSTDKGGVSPFLFPKTVEGEKYLGDAGYWKRVWLDEPESYSCVGMQKAASFFGMTEFDENGFPQNAKDGDVVNLGGLYRRQADTWVSFSDEFVFDFSKYMKRNRNFWGRDSVDAVSILLGANDFGVPYSETEAKVAEVTEKFEMMIHSIKEYDSGIKIVLNLPILGAGTSFPEALQHNSTVKRYRYNILSFCEKILEKWDNPESVQEGIYICPMMNFLDMEGGFEKEYRKISKYTEKSIPVYTNWVHPSVVGYKQMGDILSGLIAYLL